MLKLLKILLLTAAGIVGALAVAAVAVVLIRGADAQREVQALASEALGMQVEVGGPLRLRLFPSVHVTMEDVAIRNRGFEIASAAQASIGIEIVPLLRREVRMDSVALKHVRISIERRRDGTFNFETRANRKEAARPADRPEAIAAGDASAVASIAKLSLADATLVYTDRRSSDEFRADSCDLELRQLQLRPALQKLSFTGSLACDDIRAKEIVWSDVESPIRAKSGVFELDALELRVFDGRGSGNIRVDLSGPVPRYRVRYSLSRFQLAEFARALTPRNIGGGPMDFSTELSLSGRTFDELMRSAAGEASLRGDDLVLEIGDIDKPLSRYEASQNFNLVDAGAVFLAGPVGIAVTKGYNFASLLKTERGSTRIPTFVSEWRIERGIARAKDVAMTTKNHRIAMTGGLDFVDRRFDEVTVALVDARGCPSLQQRIRGSFEKPEIEKPSVLKAVSGPARNLIGRATSFFGKRCAVFYEGSVAAPR